MHRTAHNAVGRLAPRRSAPMYNIGAVTAVMADALLKDTGQFDHESKVRLKASGDGEERMVKFCCTLAERSINSVIDNKSSY